MKHYTIGRVFRLQCFVSEFDYSNKMDIARALIITYPLMHTQLEVGTTTFRILWILMAGKDDSRLSLLHEELKRKATGHSLPIGR